MGLLVVCGRGDVIETFSPTSRFTRVLFPTFGLPTTAIKPLLSPLGEAPLTQRALTGVPGRRSWAGSPRTGSVAGRKRPPRRPLGSRTRAEIGGRRRRESTGGRSG